MIYVPANSQFHVGTSPPLYWTLTQNEDVMTSNKCFKYNHPTKPKGLMCGRLDLEPHFLGRLRHERFTSNQIAIQHRTSFAGRHKQPIYFFKPQWAGPILPLHPLYHNNWSLPYRFGSRLLGLKEIGGLLVPPGKA